MMGRDEKDQGQFFYAFNLEDHIPKDHLLRSIDHFLDLSGLHDHLAPYYSHTGRPSIDPELMMRMLNALFTCFLFFPLISFSRYISAIAFARDMFT